MEQVLSPAAIGAPAARPGAPADLPAEPLTALCPGRPSGSRRLLFIDNIRWVMIILVLSMHAAVTYSGLGSWYYNEPSALSRPELLTFAAYQSVLQSFFMGLLFFIAGYFVPGAYDKKGPGRFLRDRAFRLGLPSLLYIFVLHPVTCYYAAGLWDTGHGFSGAYRRYIVHGRFLSGNGPLWFCIALLFFCLMYAGWRSFLKPAGRPDRPTAFPRVARVLGFIGLIAIATFLVRVPFPNGTDVYNMQFCYFSQYIAFFIAGTLAYRHGWLSTLSAAAGRRWGLIAGAGGLVLWLGILVAGGAFSGNLRTFGGGWHWQSMGMSIWEAFSGTGISIGCLALFRERFSRQHRWTAFFSANAFAVYVFHPPILIAITRVMNVSSLHGEALLNFLLATVLCIIFSFAGCALVLRHIPLLKNIL